VIVDCDFCGNKGDWKNVLRSAEIQKKDGSDIVLCNDCLNYYANGKFEKIKLKRVEK
jgi:hypothetical protein